MGLFSIFGRNQSLCETTYLEGGIDYHSHVLYGVDDGAATLEDSLQMLDYMENIGIAELWCTPHIMEDIPNETEILKDRFADLCSMYSGNIKLHLAAEYMLDNLFEARLSDNDLLPLDETNILVETSCVNPPYSMDELLYEIKSKGFFPLLAHPERYRYLRNGDYERLAADGVRFQLNLPSLTGYYGDTAKGKAEWLLEQGMYSYYGSDCHRLGTFRRQYNTKELNKSILPMLKSLLKGEK